MTQPPSQNSKARTVPEEPPEPPPEAGDIPIPFSREAEEAVIGAVLIDPDVYVELAQFLQATDFFIVRHRWIWEAFTSLYQDQTPLDYLTVCEELRRAGRLDDLGGSPYLTALLNQVPSSLHAVAYAHVVKEQARKRQVLEIAKDLTTGAYNNDESAASLATRALAWLTTIQPDSPRYVVHSAAEALEPHPPTEWILEPLLSQGSVAIFYGEPGTKKTYSLLSMAVCVAAGKPWLEMKTHQTRVLIIDEESGERRMFHRLGSALRGELVDKDCPIEFISLGGFHLDNPADVLLLNKEIEASGAGLVIFDALADLMQGDENSKQDTQPVLNALRRLAEQTDAAMCVIHHANKVGGYRGSSAIKGAVDLMVQVTSEDGSPYINFKSEKNRDGEAISWSAKAAWVKEPEQFYLSFAPGQGKEQRKTLSKAQSYVIDYLTEHGPSPLPAIMESADRCTENAARQAVYSLAGMGKVYRTNPGAKPAIYDFKESICLIP